MGRLIDETDLMNLLWCLDDARHELRYAIKKIPELPAVEAIPKANYEKRLKADMVAMLTDIQLEIAELPAHVISDKESIIRMEIAPSATDAYEVIQEKIDDLKENL